MNEILIFFFFVYKNTTNNKIYHNKIIVSIKITLIRKLFNLLCGKMIYNSNNVTYNYYIVIIKSFAVNWSCMVLGVM